MIDMPPSNVETGNTGAAVTRGKSHADRASAQRRWRLHLGLLIVLVILIAAAYWSTLTGIVSIWIRSETFAHGFVIFPIVAWLIYRIRDELAGFEPRIGWLGLPMLLGIGCVWALGRTADALVVQQFAFVGFIVASAWLLLGRELVWQMAFPLGFMFLAVPAGEFLIPHMMHFTAMFTVKAIQLTGIPVYWEGTHITLPTGTWSVIAACSGIRYLMATVTVALLFGYLTYRSYWRRAAFLLFAIVVAVVGNGLRAYGIVMLGYLSDMRIAVGFDHIIRLVVLRRSGGGIAVCRADLAGSAGAVHRRDRGRHGAAEWRRQCREARRRGHNCRGAHCVLARARHDAIGGVGSADSDAGV